MIIEILKTAAKKAAPVAEASAVAARAYATSLYGWLVVQPITTLSAIGVSFIIFLYVVKKTVQRFGKRKQVPPQKKEPTDITLKGLSGLSGLSVHFKSRGENMSASVGPYNAGTSITVDEFEGKFTDSLSKMILSLYLVKKDSGSPLFEKTPIRVNYTISSVTTTNLSMREFNQESAENFLRNASKALDLISQSLDKDVSNDNLRRLLQSGSDDAKMAAARQLIRRNVVSDDLIRAIEKKDSISEYAEHEKLLLSFRANDTFLPTESDHVSQFIDDKHQYELLAKNTLANTRSGLGDQIEAQAIMHYDSALHDNLNLSRLSEGQQSTIAEGFKETLMDIASIAKNGFLRLRFLDTDENIVFAGFLGSISLDGIESARQFIAFAKKSLYQFSGDSALKLKDALLSSDLNLVTATGKMSLVTHLKDHLSTAEGRDSCRLNQEFALDPISYAELVDSDAATIRAALGR